MPIGINMQALRDEFDRQVKVIRDDFDRKAKRFNEINEPFVFIRFGGAAAPDGTFTISLLNRDKLIEAMIDGSKEAKDRIEANKILDGLLIAAGDMGLHYALWNLEKLQAECGGKVIAFDLSTADIMGVVHKSTLTPKSLADTLIARQEQVIKIVGGGLHCERYEYSSNNSRKYPRQSRS